MRSIVSSPHHCALLARRTTRDVARPHQSIFCRGFVSSARDAFTNTTPATDTPSHPWSGMLPSHRFYHTKGGSSAPRPRSARHRGTVDPRVTREKEAAAVKKASRVIVPEGLVKAGSREKQLVPPSHHSSKQGKWKMPARLTETEEQQAERLAKPLQSQVRDARQKGQGVQKLDVENARNYNRLAGCPVNHDIDSSSTIRLLFPDGRNEVMPFERAMQEAEDADLDLVQWAGKGKEVICKMMDFAEELEAARQKDYEEKKDKKKTASKKKKVLPEKEIRFGSGIGENDFRMKITKGAGFLDKGHPLMLHVELRRSGDMDQEDRAKRALELIARATTMLADVGTEMSGQKKVMLGQIRNKYAPLSAQDKAKIEKVKNKELAAELRQAAAEAAEAEAAAQAAAAAAAAEEEEEAAVAEPAAAEPVAEPASDKL
jgi:translation initiation factor IF-3